jgi:hypothetical protein
MGAAGRGARRIGEPATAAVITASIPLIQLASRLSRILLDGSELAYHGCAGVRPMEKNEMTEPWSSFFRGPCTRGVCRIENLLARVTPSSPDVADEEES